MIYTLILNYIESINILDTLIERFAETSGLKMNRDKTFIILLVLPSDENIAIPFGKVVHIITILSIYFSLEVESQEI